MQHSDFPSLSRLHYLHEGVSAVLGLFRAEGFGHTLSVGHEGTMGQTRGQRRFVDLQKTGIPHNSSFNAEESFNQVLLPLSRNISAEKKALTPSSDAAMLKCSDLLTSLVSKLFSVLAGGNTRSNNNNKNSSSLCSRSHKYTCS